MKNQKQFVIDELLKNHKISRNFCLQNYISRLGALILILKKEGWLFESEYENGDYVYRVVGEPIKDFVMPVKEKQQEPLFNMRVPLS